MKWLWGARANGWTNLTSSSGAYRGHVLDRCAVTIGCWRCVHCGDLFALPDEPDCYDVALRERVAVEELPTEEREAAALILAMCASATASSGNFSPTADLLAGGENEARTAIVNTAYSAWKRSARVRHPLKDKQRYALAEALLRTGEV